MKYIGKGVLWQTQKYYFDVDFIAIATLQEEDVLLLFQVSTRKTDHITKCEPLVPCEVHTLTISRDTMPPNTIVYLYINPFFFAEKEYEKAYSIFCNCDKNRQRKWFFEIPSNRSQLLAIYESYFH